MIKIDVTEEKGVTMLNKRVIMKISRKRKTKIEKL